MTETTNELHLISDFNAKQLGQFLMTLKGSSPFSVKYAPFGQVYQSLQSDTTESGGIGLIWTLPERIIPTFSKAMQMEEVSHEDCIKETQAFASAILKFAEQKKYVFVTSWILPPGFRGYGLLDWKPGIGLAGLIANMNSCLAVELSRARNVYILDSSRWIEGIQRPLSPKMWYATKVPFSIAVFEKAARDVLSAIHSVSGRTRKLLIIDLDNTIWGGVIGETGWQGIRLGGHDHVGEAFQQFQLSLLALVNRGVQIAVVSKNDELVALEAFDHHPEMRIRREHLAGWRINWQDKAANIASLAEELNLGLSAIVFVDDNPAERDRVSAALPDVLVPNWPIDPSFFVSALRSLDCFDIPAVTSEDRNRTAMYVAERERREVRLGADSIDSWLSGLETRIQVASVDTKNIGRVAQLFNKTNQLNLSTRRLTEADILDWVNATNRSMLAISSSDKFGDMGLVGVVSIEVESEQGILVDFILSCRVMGRKVEDAMLNLAAREITRLGGKTFEARYLPTSRNRPTLDVLRASALTEHNDNVFKAEFLDVLAKPEHLFIDLSPLRNRT